MCSKKCNENTKDSTQSPCDREPKRDQQRKSSILKQIEDLCSLTDELSEICLIECLCPEPATKKESSQADCACSKRDSSLGEKRETHCIQLECVKTEEPKKPCPEEEEEEEENDENVLAKLIVKAELIRKAHRTGTEEHGGKHGQVCECEQTEQRREKELLKSKSKEKRECSCDECNRDKHMSTEKITCTLERKPCDKPDDVSFDNQSCDKCKKKSCDKREKKSCDKREKKSCDQREKKSCNKREKKSCDKRDDLYEISVFFDEEPCEKREKKSCDNHDKQPCSKNLKKKSCDNNEICDKRSCSRREEKSCDKRDKSYDYESRDHHDNSCENQTKRSSHKHKSCDKQLCDERSCSKRSNCG